MLSNTRNLGSPRYSSASSFQFPVQLPFQCYYRLTNHYRGAAPAPAARRGRAGAETEKIAYLKNLMTKYLGTADPDAKEHMERAVMMVLGYTDDEKARILADRDASGSGLAPAGLAAWWG